MKTPEILLVSAFIVTICLIATVWRIKTIIFDRLFGDKPVNSMVNIKLVKVLLLILVTIIITLMIIVL